MARRFIILFLILFIHLSGLVLQAQNNQSMNSATSIRVESLIKSMTLEQKAMQLQIRAFSNVRQFMDAEGNLSAEKLKQAFPNGIGGLNLDINMEPETYVKVGNQLQQFSVANGAGIPILFIGEGLHGFMSRGATSFPQAIALGCSWDTLMAERIFSATALEASARGVRQLFSPVLDLAREPRFGRTEEMYSEDAYLVAAMGTAAVNGFQGRSSSPDAQHVAATVKHFVGHGQPEGGRNTAPINISRYDLINEHLYPFEQVIKTAHPVSLMPSYNEMEGIPNHANSWLLNDVLRGILGFTGHITSDQNAIDELARLHALVSTPEEAAALALRLHIPVDLQGQNGTYETLPAQVRAGTIKLEELDNAVRQVLNFKASMGLFDRPLADANAMNRVTNNAAHKALALEAAEKSLVLLKNQNNTLPLDISQMKKMAVIGPLAKGVHFGGYTAEPRVGVDVLEGITQFARGQFEVLYAEGCKISTDEGTFWGNRVPVPNSEENDRMLIKEAVATALKSDVVLLALGEHESFGREGWGEDHRDDRTDLTLPGLQNELGQELLKTGKPIVAVMFGSRPLGFPLGAQHIPAIIQAFYLGQATGTALANTLFGKNNPSGKLSITFPKSVGELPAYYSRKPSRNRSYILEENAPVYPFGFGLSYTSYAYGTPRLDKTAIKVGESVNVTVEVTNTGKYAGEEIVQMYLRDMVSSAVRPIMELKDFARIHLKPGETKPVQFTITPEKMMFYNSQLKKVLEPGDFRAMVGPNSQTVQALTFSVQP